MKVVVVVVVVVVVWKKQFENLALSCYRETSKECENAEKCPLQNDVHKKMDGTTSS